MTATPSAAPRRSASAVRRTRAVVGAVLWTAVLVPPVLAGVFMLGAARPSRALDRLLRLVDGAVAGAPLPADLLLELRLNSPFVAVVVLLWAVAVALSIIAAVVTPTAPARRIIAPVVVVLGIVPAWAGSTTMLSGFQRLAMEPLAGGAMLLGLALAVAVLGAWIGLGSTPGGLAAVPLAAFLGVLVPLAALAIVTIAPGVGSNPLVSGPTRMLLSLHWIASLVLAATAALAALILLRTATYRRR